MPGFGFNETMSGTWTDGAQERRFRFTAEVRTGPLRRFRKDHVARMEGRVEADGLARDAALTGTVVLRPLLGRVIRYQFEFTGDDGKRYQFAGQKDIRWLDPVRSWTELPAEISDGDGKVIGQAMARFDLRTTVPFLLSFRPSFGAA